MVVSPFFFHNDDLIKILIHVTEKMRCRDTRRANNKMTVNLFKWIPFFDQQNTTHIDLLWTPSNSFEQFLAPTEYRG